MTTGDGLSLYHYEGCPFCRRVLDAADRLGLRLELRDILDGSSHRKQLVDATGRQTVPCLRIEEPNTPIRWLFESAEIIAYLGQRFGAPRGSER